VVESHWIVFLMICILRLGVRVIFASLRAAGMGFDHAKLIDKI
jgi:hypothetical protein